MWRVPMHSFKFCLLILLPSWLLKDYGRFLVSKNDFYNIIFLTKVSKTKNSFIVPLNNPIKSNNPITVKNGSKPQKSAICLQILAPCQKSFFYIWITFSLYSVFINMVLVLKFYFKECFWYTNVNLKLSWINLVRIPLEKLYIETSLSIKPFFLNYM